MAERCGAGAEGPDLNPGDAAGPILPARHRVVIGRWGSDSFAAGPKICAQERGADSSGDKPAITAYFVSSATLCLLSFCMSRRRWVSTVLVPTPSARAISLVVSPDAMWPR